MRAEQFDLHAEIEHTHWWFVARRRIMAALVRRALPPSPDATVIDVGCGAGGNLAELAGDYRCVGIDTSGRAIELAKRRFPNIRFIHGHAPPDLGGEIASARMILIMDVLEHVRDDRQLLSDLVAAAPPGAMLLLTVPADPAMWSRHDDSFGHFRRYDLERFRRLWHELPLREMLVSYYNSRLYRPIKLVRAMGRLRGRSHGLAGTDFRVPRAPLNRALMRIFQSESRRLVDVLENRRRPFARGVSLIAVLKRNHNSQKEVP